MTIDCADMVGKRFHHLVVLSQAEPLPRKDGSREAAVLCRCDCGREVVVKATLLRRSQKKSCGCGISHRDVVMPGSRLDITGERIGSWSVGEAVKVYGRSGRSNHCSYYYRCRCDCGTERLVSGVALMDGKSLSCGCRTWSGTPRKSFVREGDVK